MTSEANRPAPSRLLRLAVVLDTTEETCGVFAAGQRSEVGYMPAFPRPRVERVSPGNLTAIATAADGSEVVVWRWFDAVVLSEGAGLISLWEPAHGVVRAQPRNAEGHRQPGSRVYLSAGLPGADWWVAGEVETRPEAAVVEVDEVERFLTGHGLLDAHSS